MSRVAQVRALESAGLCDSGKRGLTQFIQSFLLDAGISLVLAVKPSVMADVARSTGAESLSGIDQLSLNPQLGTCKRFHTEAHAVPVEADAPDGIKAFMYFEGCNPKVCATALLSVMVPDCFPIQLFATIVLRGGPLDELKRLKRVLDFMIYAAYSTYLESALLEDQFIRPPHPQARTTNEDAVQIANLIWNLATRGHADSGAVPIRARS